MGMCLKAQTYLVKNARAIFYTLKSLPSNFRIKCLIGALNCVLIEYFFIIQKLLSTKLVGHKGTFFLGGGGT